MPPTVLFDLDDTLLSTNMDQFLPGYFKALSTALSHLGSPEKITRHINSAVNQMVANQNPGKTLKEVFDSHFYAPLGTTEAACRENLQAFYQNEYPHLKSITQAKPQAKQLVNWCRSQGMRMVIATNPLFPQSATRQRIEWAGLLADEFEFFTTYDDFHFTKPHLAYYVEVLGRLGWPEGPVVMVGDNLPYDLLPMDTMGFPTFWVTAKRYGVRWNSGTLADVKPWLNQVMQDDIEHLANDPEVHIAILRATPAVIDTWLRQIRADQITENGSPQDDHFIQMLSYIADLEWKVFLPLWASFLKNPRKSRQLISEIEPITQDFDNRPNPESEFNRFLEARHASLVNIDKLHRKEVFIHVKHLDQSKSPTIKDALVFISDQDRKALQKLNNLCNLSVRPTPGGRPRMLRSY
jgi:FMN phosphatase YigB (HAD superfamily)